MKKVIFLLFALCLGKAKAQLSDTTYFEFPTKKCGTCVGSFQQLSTTIFHPKKWWVEIFTRPCLEYKRDALFIKKKKKHGGDIKEILIPASTRNDNFTISTVIYNYKDSCIFVKFDSPTLKKGKESFWIFSIPKNTWFPREEYFWKKRTIFDSYHGCSNTKKTANKISKKNGNNKRSN